MRIFDNVNLKKLNTLSIDVTAKCLVDIKSEACLRSIMPKLKESDYLVLGGGSNVLFSQDYFGIVMCNKMLGVTILSEDDLEVHVSVAGGEGWHSWVLYALRCGWHGLENLALIPGTVGASPIQNIGAYGVEMASCCQSVTAMDLTTGDVVVYSAEDCQFAYRDSYFKQNKNHFILSVEFRLSKSYTPQLKYAPLAALAENLGVNPTASQVVKWVCDIRQAKLPDPAVLPNAGSFFKNPVVSESVYLSIKLLDECVVAYKQEGGYKLAAAWLIDRLGMKGVCQNGVCVNEKQALVLINKSGSGQDVLSMAARIRDAVKERYGVLLEIEPRIV